MRKLHLPFFLLPGTRCGETEQRGSKKKEFSAASPQKGAPTSSTDEAGGGGWTCHLQCSICCPFPCPVRSDLETTLPLSMIHLYVWLCVLVVDASQLWTFDEQFSCKVITATVSSHNKIARLKSQHHFETQLFEI